MDPRSAHHDARAVAPHDPRSVASHHDPRAPLDPRSMLPHHDGGRDSHHAVTHHDSRSSHEGHAGMQGARSSGPRHELVSAPRQDARSAHHEAPAAAQHAAPRPPHHDTSRSPHASAFTPHASQHVAHHYTDVQDAKMDVVNDNRPRSAHTPERQTVQDSKGLEAKLPAGHPLYQTYPPGRAPPVKQEAGFSLYGYQPFQHTYISQDKLYALKEGRAASDKDGVQRKSNPISSPPPLTKDKHSVIIEPRPQSRESSPHSAPQPHPATIQLSPLAAGALPARHMLAHGGSISMGTAIPQRAPQVMPSRYPDPRLPSPHKYNPSSGQNLVPVVYSGTSVGHAAKTAPEAQRTSGGPASLPAPPHTTALTGPPSQPGIKRHSPTLSPAAQSLKRPKTGNSPAVSPPHTSQRPASPHTLGTNATANSNAAVRPPGGFMDSFRSFVENTVQSAFNQDSESSSRERHKAAASAVITASPHPHASHTPSSGTPPMPMLSRPSSTPALPYPSAPSTPGTLSRPSQSVTPSSVQPQQTQSPVPRPAAPTTPQPRPVPCTTPGSVSSTSSIHETIARITNGFQDTDSDTLSAPSPPPHTLRPDVTTSPKAHNHTKFKKAWLQRYSDEDKDKPTDKCKADPAPVSDVKVEMVKEEITVSPIPSDRKGTPSPHPYMKTEPMNVNASIIKSEVSVKKESLPQSSFTQGSNLDERITGSPLASDASATSIPLASDASATSISESPTNAVESNGVNESKCAKFINDIELVAKDSSKPKVVEKEAQQLEKSEGSSHSDAESQSEDSSSKRKVKCDKRNNGPAKKAKFEASKEPEKSKKRFTRKAKDDVKEKKDVSDDEIVRDNKEREERRALVRRAQDEDGQEETKVKSDAEIKLDRKRRSRLREAKENEKKEEKEQKKDDKKNESSADSEEDGSTDKNIPKAESSTADTSAALVNKPLNKQPLSKLKRSQLPFLQDDSCSEVTPKLMKCRECKMTPHQRNKKMPNIFCRFYAFRRLRYNTKQALTIAGFSEPTDAEADDISLWMPALPLGLPQLDLQMAKYLLANVGDQFCELVEQEKEAMGWVSPDTKIAWKRAVPGVREMCDVCNTTLFNMHWVCHRCGFVVCIDCYRMRTRKGTWCQDERCTTCDTDGPQWLKCSVNRQIHDAEKLMLTQIIPSDALWAVGRMIHEVREKWHITSQCVCIRNKAQTLLAPKNGIKAHKTNSTADDMKPMPVVNGDVARNGDAMFSLSLLADIASLDTDAAAGALREKFAREGHLAEAGAENGGDTSSLRELLTRAGAAANSPHSAEEKKKGTKAAFHSTLDDIIQQLSERSHSREERTPAPQPLKHYIPRSGGTMQGPRVPIPTHTLTETSVLFPDVPHSWLDGGRLLRLHDPRHAANLSLFQQQWRRAQPVLVSNTHRHLQRKLWTPSAFSHEFGHLENDLINCRTGVVIIGHLMREFWDGFEHVKLRLCDEKGYPMILKLKDWPPSEDFLDSQPGRFQDLMKALPLPEYSHRHGIFNLASRLPDFFVRPDLGPKMYNAYGGARHPREATTNLHLDMSDAVNLIVYVGIPTDDKYDHKESVGSALDEAEVCALTKQRIKEGGERPGALWHIYDPQDADKIRDLLNKVGIERGDDIEPHHDPIHDQSWYLDRTLRHRLRAEYDVQGYTIVQCMGDAVFIPAGAPHQVRNLHSCIKIAEDFVSPEGLHHCFKLTQEFRHLSDTHSNHEDKLQVKNTIYHVVKDAVSVLRDLDL